MFFCSAIWTDLSGGARKESHNKLIQGRMVGATAVVNIDITVERSRNKGEFLEWHGHFDTKIISRLIDLLISRFDM